MQAWPCFIRLYPSVTAAGTLSSWVNEPGPSGPSSHLGGSRSGIHIGSGSMGLDEPQRQSGSGQEGLLSIVVTSRMLSSSFLELGRFFSSVPPGIPSGLPGSCDQQLLVSFVRLSSASLLRKLVFSQPPLGSSLTAAPNPHPPDNNPLHLSRLPFSHYVDASTFLSTQTLLWKCRSATVSVVIPLLFPRLRLCNLALRDIKSGTQFLYTHKKRTESSWYFTWKVQSKLWL